MEGAATSGGEEEHPAFKWAMDNEVGRVKELLTAGYAPETRGAVRSRVRAPSPSRRGAARRCARAQRNETALIRAAMYGRAEVCALLLDHEGDALAANGERR